MEGSSFEILSKFSPFFSKLSGSFHQNVLLTQHRKRQFLHLGTYSYHCVGGHDDVVKWKHFPRYWPFMRGIHRSPVNSPHKGQWRGAFMFPLICVWINGWVNIREAGDLRCRRAHYDVIVMVRVIWWFTLSWYAATTVSYGVHVTVPMSMFPVANGSKWYWGKWTTAQEGKRLLIVQCGAVKTRSIFPDILTIDSP